MLDEKQFSHVDANSWSYKSSPGKDDGFQSNDHVDRQEKAESQVINILGVEWVIKDFFENLVINIVAYISNKGFKEGSW